jgi:hypothetical protein
MRRREFTALAGAAAVTWPFAAQAQQSKVRRIGCLLLGNADADSFKVELVDGLRKLGYFEGQNIVFLDLLLDLDCAGDGIYGARELH